MQPSHSQSKYINSSSTPVALGNVQSSHRYSLEKLKEFEAKLLLQGHSLSQGQKSAYQADRAKMNFAEMADATVYGMTKTVVPGSKAPNRLPSEFAQFSHTTMTPSKALAGADGITRNALTVGHFGSNPVPESGPGRM